MLKSPKSIVKSNNKSSAITEVLKTGITTVAGANVSYASRQKFVIRF